MDYNNLIAEHFPIEEDMPTDHTRTQPNTQASAYVDNPLQETMSDQEMYKSFSAGLYDEQRTLTEEQLLADANFIEASKVMWYKENNGEPKLSDEEMSKWGLDYISHTSYNLTKMGATAYNVSEYDNKQKLSLAYMMDALDDKDITWNGVGKALSAMALDPTTYIGVGAGAKIMGRAGINSFKSKLLNSIVASSVEGALYTGTEEALMQEIDQETLGTEKDPLAVALAGLVGGTIGAALPPALVGAVKGTKALGKGAMKMAQEKLDTPMGDMLTGTMRMQESGKVPSEKGLLARHAKMKSESVKPKGKEIFNPETNKSYIVGEDGLVYFDSTRGWRETKQFGIKQRLEEIDKLGYDEFKAREDASIAEMRKIEEEQIQAEKDGDYKGSHTAPTKDNYNASGFDPTEVFGEDIYSPQASRYFGHGDKKLDDKSISIIKSMKGNPNKEVTIYRAVPKGVKGINKGDWVTINKDYAKSHGESHIEGDYDIIEVKVKAKDIYTDGNSIHEWGYDPRGDN